jgi:hypothetical protein
VNALNGFTSRDNAPKLAAGTEWMLRSNKRFRVTVTQIEGQLVKFEAMRGKRSRQLSVYGFLQVYLPVA